MISSARLKQVDRLTWISFALSILFFISGHIDALAHPPISSVVHLVVQPDGLVRVTVEHDPLAFALGGVSVDVDDEQMLQVWSQSDVILEELLRKSLLRWKQELILRLGDQSISWGVRKSPETEDFRDWKSSKDGLPLPGAMQLVIEGTIPVGFGKLSIQLPVILDQVLLVVERPGLERSFLPLDPGDESPPLEILIGVVDFPEVVPRGLVPNEEGGVGESHREIDQVGRGGEMKRDSQKAMHVSMHNFWGDRVITLGRFVRLGFLHIVPNGIDHALFVVGLFLLSPTFKSLLYQVSAFTIAHMVSMTLASFEIISAPSWLIEPFIAISIGFVAVENFLMITLSRWRLGVAFGFGLIHGLGFATGLRDHGLLPDEVVLSLGAFTFGVELGHLVILLFAWVVIGSLRGFSWYRNCVVLPLSMAIGVIAMVWFYDRVG